MKVLFISNDPTIFDDGSATRARMRAYAGALGELHIISPAKKGAIYIQEGNLFLYPVHAWKIFRMYVLARKARGICREYEIELISTQDPFEQGQAALYAMFGIPTKLHVQVHTDFLSPGFLEGGRRIRFLNTHRRKIADHVLPLASGIRVVSERVKASLVARYGDRIIEPSVIPIAVSTATPEPASLPTHQFTFAMMTVSRLEPEKHIEDVLAALQIIVAKYPMTGLFIVGSGSERAKLEALVETLSLRGKVVFLGECANATALMRDAQAFIQVSSYEGYGRTLVEAALARVPIVTTDVGIVGEVFKNEQEVLAVPIHDPVAIAKAVERLIEDNSLRQMLPINARVAAETHLAAMGDIPARIVADFAVALRHER